MTSTYYVLHIQRVKGAPETLSLAAPLVTIGRDSGDIALGDPLASGRHAEIHFQNGQVFVRDLGSTNGTYVNGSRLPQFVLQPGQWFQCGQTVLTLMAIYGQQAAPQYAPPPQAPAPAPPQAPAPQAPAYQAAMPYQHAQPQMAPSAPLPHPPAYPYGQPAAAAAAYPQATPAPVLYGQQAGAPAPFGGPVATPPPPYPYGGQPAPGMGAPPGGMPPQYPGAQGSYPDPGRAQGAGGAAASPAMVPYQPAPPQQLAGGGGGPMGIRPEFVGTGGEIFKKLFVGFLLTAITAGIYGAWFFCGFLRYVQSKVTIGPTARGRVHMQFTGTGGKLFVTGFVGYLLTILTCGIYGPWFVCKLIRFFTENTTATADDGTRYELKFEGTGGQFLVTFLVGGLLSLITLYIYMPWFFCKMQRLILQRTFLHENGQRVGTFDFTGRGGELFGTAFVGYLLTVITLGIYFAWFQVKMMQFFTRNTRITVHGRTYVGDFTGTGGQLFVINLVGVLLLPITLYIYMFWLIAKQLRFQINNLLYREALPG